MRRAKWILFVGMIFSIYLVGREYVDAEKYSYTYNGDTYNSHEVVDMA